jgi:hypothetical protein
MIRCRLYRRTSSTLRAAAGSTKAGNDTGQRLQEDVERRFV